MVNIPVRKKFDGSGEYTVETLAEKYKHGYKLDINFVSQNKPSGTHCGNECFRLVKINYE
jgi:hypothetical protein